MPPHRLDENKSQRTSRPFADRLHALTRKYGVPSEMTEGFLGDIAFAICFELPFGSALLVENRVMVSTCEVKMALMFSGSSVKMYRVPKMVISAVWPGRSRQTVIHS